MNKYIFENKITKRNNLEVFYKSQIQTIFK